MQRYGKWLAAVAVLAAWTCLAPAVYGRAGALVKNSSDECNQPVKFGNIVWANFAEQSATPATPGAGFSRVYVKSDGLYVVDDAGTVTGPLVDGGVFDAANVAITGGTISGVLFPDSIVFEGATANDFETTLAVTDPTATRTITLPDKSGTVALTSDIPAEADTLGTVTGRGASTATPLEFTGGLDLGEAATTAGDVEVHHGGTLKFWDAGNDTSVTFGPVGNGTTTLGVTGTIDATGLKVGGTSVLTAEADTLATVAARGSVIPRNITVADDSFANLNIDIVTARNKDYPDAGEVGQAASMVLGGILSYHLQSGTPISNAKFAVLQGYKLGDFCVGTTAAPDFSTCNSGFRLRVLNNNSSIIPLQTVAGGKTEILLGLKVANGATSAGYIEISEDSDDGSNTVTLTVPALDASYTLTLPNTDGDASQVLTTDGSGVLSWTTPAAEADTLDSVAERGATTDVALTISDDAGNADFVALTLQNADEPANEETGQSVTLNLSGKGTSDSGSNYTNEVLGSIVAYKINDFFGSDETQFDSALKFGIQYDGAMQYPLSIAPDGMVTINTLHLAAGPYVDTIETALTDDDQHLPTSGAVVDYVAGLGYATDVAANKRWKVLTKTTHWDDQAASTSTITMNADLTATLSAGLPVKFKLSGSYYYAVMTAITSNLMTLAGAPLTTGDGDLEELYYGDPEMVTQLCVFVAGTYGDGTEADLLVTDMGAPLKWYGPAMHLVSFAAAHDTVDTGTEPKVNVQINNAAVSTNDTNAGVQLGAADTFVLNSAVAINTSNYDVNWGEEIEVACTAAGGTGDAADLTVILTFVAK